MLRIWSLRASALAVVLFSAACGGDAGGGAGADCTPLDLDAAGMETAVAEMLATADTVERHRSAIAIGDALTTDNLPGFVQALDDNINKVDPNEVRLLAHAWADVDPKGALDHILEEWRYPRVSNGAVEEVVYVWAASGDGASARAYVDPSFDGPVAAPRSPTRFMQLAVLKALGVAQDFENLTALFASVEDPGDRDFWTTRVLIEMNRVHGMPAIRGWVDSIPWDAPNDLKMAALKKAIDWRARGSYADAQAWYEELEAEQPRPALLDPVVQAQGVREPANAILWLAERPQDNERDRLIREIMNGWMIREDPAVRDEARTWAVSQVNHEVLGPLVSPLVVRGFVGGNRVREAADFVLANPEVTNPERLLPFVLVRWASIDVDAVDAYIKEKGIDEEIVEAYQQELKRIIDSGVKVTRQRVRNAGGEEENP